MWEIYPKGTYDLLTRIWKDYSPTFGIMSTERHFILIFQIKRLIVCVSEQPVSDRLARCSEWDKANRTVSL